MMSILTPTMPGSLLAEVVFYALPWVAIHKVDEIPIVRDVVTSNHSLPRINRHKAATLLVTEGLSAALHGVASPTAVLFNLGGTVLNAAVLFGYLRGRDLLSQISAEIWRSA